MCKRFIVPQSGLQSLLCFVAGGGPEAKIRGGRWEEVDEQNDEIRVQWRFEISLQSSLFPVATC